MLNIKKENLSGSKVKLTIEIPAARLREFFTKVYERMSEHVQVKGFRSGKAPQNLTIAAIGENRIVSEIINMALSETYAEALKKEELIPVAPPQVNIKKMADLLTDNPQLEYEVEVDLLPEVKLGDYKKIKIKKKQRRNKSNSGRN